MTEDLPDPPDPPDPPDADAGHGNVPAAEEDRAAALGRTLLTIHKQMQPAFETELGSTDAAQDALQDAWEKLLAGESAIGAVRNPKAYLRRMVLNLGRNNRRATARFVSLDQMLINDLADPAPDPERYAAARHELALVTMVLGELPPRRRTIFLDKFRDGLSLDETARLRGVHRRTVQKELDRAVRFLRVRLKRAP